MITWKDFIEKVNAVIDANGITHDQVDVEYIDITGYDSINVEVAQKQDGRYDLIVD